MLSTYNTQFSVNGTPKQIEVVSKSFKRGDDKCLFEDTMFRNSEMVDNGFTIQSLPPTWWSQIQQAITTFIKDKITENGVDISENFCLQEYHRYVTDNAHNKIVNSFRGGTFGLGGIPIDRLGIDCKELEDMVNLWVDSKYQLSCCNIFGFRKQFWIRIVRPMQEDNNPPHKDAHLRRLRNAINIYVPLAGSNEKSSLPLIPGSHKESEQEYIVSDTPCVVNNKKFTVPAIVHRNNGLNLITPNPSRGEIMLFTPYLIHGGGINSNDNLTRVSLEMRFM